MVRAICPQCGSNNTWAHFEHQVASSPNEFHKWEREAELQPDGRPVSVPCPGCTDGIKHEPQYFYCRSCNHSWSPTSGTGK